jgi:NADP-dependent 3-hydroxy acid dehydrogenase YdfG
MTAPKPFTGLVALITGATGDIGGAIARALAEQGATVCVVGRRRQVLEALAASVAEGAEAMVAHPADLTADEDVAGLAGRIVRDFGRLDILVHSAGIIAIGRQETAAVDDFDAQYRANLRAPYALTKAVLPLLKVSQGQVVFIASTAALHVRPGLGQFAATQHAFRALADTLRDEVNADGIRVLSVYPGRTATERQERIFAEERREYRPKLLLQPEDIAEMVIAALRLPRTAEVTDITMRPLTKSY